MVQKTVKTTIHEISSMALHLVGLLKYKQPHIDHHQNNQFPLVAALVNPELLGDTQM